MWNLTVSGMKRPVLRLRQADLYLLLAIWLFLELDFKT
jgi:hypothetical protein